MQTDILLKQVMTSLADLKTAIDKFEKHPSPSTQYAEQLHTAIGHSHKLVAAYVVLKEQKDVSPELDLHLKIMSAQETKPEPVVEIKKDVSTSPVPDKKQEPLTPVVEVPKETIPEPIIHQEKEKTPEPVILAKPVVTAPVTPVKDLPKLSININDKFRFINELFASNANEYTIAIEQLNNVNSMEEATAYLKGLKNIYHWDDENEMVKKMLALTQKRFS